MLISKWGNSLAIRIPAAVIDVLELKEGDDVVITVADARGFVIGRNARNQRVIERLARLKTTLQEDFDFERFKFK